MRFPSELPATSGCNGVFQRPGKFHLVGLNSTFRLSEPLGPGPRFHTPWASPHNGADERRPGRPGGLLRRGSERAGRGARCQPLPGAAPCASAALPDGRAGQGRDGEGRQRRSTRREATFKRKEKKAGTGKAAAGGKKTKRPEPRPRREVRGRAPSARCAPNPPLGRRFQSRWKPGARGFRKALSWARSISVGYSHECSPGGGRGPCSRRHRRPDAAGALGRRRELFVRSFNSPRAAPRAPLPQPGRSHGRRFPAQTWSPGRRPADKGFP